MHPQFLKLLVCPLTKCPLQYEAETQELISPGARLAYPVRDGIPILIPDEARVLEMKSASESIENRFME